MSAGDKKPPQDPLNPTIKCHGPGQEGTGCTTMVPAFGPPICDACTAKVHEAGQAAMEERLFICDACGERASTLATARPPGQSTGGRSPC